MSQSPLLCERPCRKCLLCALSYNIALLPVLQKLFPAMSTDHSLYVCHTELVLCRFRSPYWEVQFIVKCYPHCMFEIALLFSVQKIFPSWTIKTCTATTKCNRRRDSDQSALWSTVPKASEGGEQCCTSRFMISNIELHETSSFSQCFLSTSKH
jgi:hypothetical protein